jgi:hypothetical protein
MTDDWFDLGIRRDSSLRARNNYALFAEEFNNVLTQYQLPDRLSPMTPLNRPKRCTWQYDPKVFPQLRGWFCVHTTVPGTKRCGRHPLAEGED